MAPSSGGTLQQDAPQQVALREIFSPNRVDGGWQLLAVTLPIPANQAAFL